MCPLFGFIGMPGPMEMLVIGVIVLLLFGNRLPSVMRSLGKGITEFKKGVSGIEDEVEKTTAEIEDAASKSKETGAM